MYVVKPANEGGESLYLSYNSIVEKLLQTQDGKRCLDILTNNYYPFQTPKSFDRNEKIIQAKILDPQNGTIRFRHDCIKKGLINSNELIKPSMDWALNFLVPIINHNANIKKFQALEDDLIIIDNLSGLHARTSFIDINRHYIRARVTKTDQS